MDVVIYLKKAAGQSGLLRGHEGLLCEIRRVAHWHTAYGQFRCGKLRERFLVLYRS